jgi:hypothetical protein
MNPDPRTEPVTARMIFRGLMLMCINDDRRLELGMIKCPKHNPLITITTHNGTITDEQTLPWAVDHDLIFKVNNPYENQVVPHPAASGDTEFSKIIDFEGPDFHEDGVIVETTALDGRRLGVTSGRVYSHLIKAADLDLLTWTDIKAPGEFKKNLGRITEDVGVNIFCRDEAGIEIINPFTGETLLPLPTPQGTSYEITVDNDCSKGDAPGPTRDIAGTDFRFYYDVVTSRNGEKFDLAVRTADNDAGNLHPQAPGVCELSYLSQTKSLGLRWPQF